MLKNDNTERFPWPLTSEVFLFKGPVPGECPCHQGAWTIFEAKAFFLPSWSLHFSFGLQLPSRQFWTLEPLLFRVFCTSSAWAELLPSQPPKTVPYTEGRTHWSLYQSQQSYKDLLWLPSQKGNSRTALCIPWGYISAGCTMSDTATGSQFLADFLFTVSKVQQDGLCPSSSCWCLPFLSDLLLHICPFCLSNT